MRVRLAGELDRALLDRAVWESDDPRLETFIRRDAIDALVRRRDGDYRLLVFEADDGELLGVSAHEQNFELGDEGGVPVPGSYLVVVAIVVGARGSRLEDGTPLVQAIVDATFDDVRARGRGGFVGMLVHPDNAAGHRVAARIGAQRDGESGSGEVAYAVTLPG